MRGCRQRPLSTFTAHALRLMALSVVCADPDLCEESNPLSFFGNAQIGVRTKATAVLGLPVTNVADVGACAKLCLEHAGDGEDCLSFSFVSSKSKCYLSDTTEKKALFSSAIFTHYAKLDACRRAVAAAATAVIPNAPATTASTTTPTTTPTITTTTTTTSTTTTTATTTKTFTGTFAATATKPTIAPATTIASARTKINSHGDSNGNGNGNGNGDGSNAFDNVNGHGIGEANSTERADAHGDSGNPIVSAIDGDTDNDRSTTDNATYIMPVVMDSRVIVGVVFGVLALVVGVGVSVHCAHATGNCCIGSASNNAREKGEVERRAGNGERNTAAGDETNTSSIRIGTMLANPMHSHRRSYEAVMQHTEQHSHASATSAGAALSTDQPPSPTSHYYSEIASNDGSEGYASIHFDELYAPAVPAASVPASAAPQSTETPDSPWYNNVQTLPPAALYGAHISPAGSGGAIGAMDDAEYLVPSPLPLSQLCSGGTDTKTGTHGGGGGGSSTLVGRKRAPSDASRQLTVAFDQEYSDATAEVGSPESQKSFKLPTSARATTDNRDSFGYDYAMDPAMDNTEC